MVLRNPKSKKKTLMREFLVSTCISVFCLSVILFSLFHNPERTRDKRIARDDEYSDSEDEGDGRKDSRSYKEPIIRKRPRLTKEDYGKKPSPSPTPSSTTDDIKITAPIFDSFLTTSPKEGQDMETGKTKRYVYIFMFPLRKLLFMI